MKVISPFLFGLFLSIITPANLSAQESDLAPGEAKKTEKPKAHITVIALGAVAKRRYEISEKQTKNAAGEDIVEKGTPILIPPKEGESPPGMLYFRGNKDEDNYQRIRVGFNNPAGVYKLEPNKAYDFYRRNEKSGSEYAKYLTIPAFTENSQTLIFLTQKSKRTNRWMNEPKMSMIDLNSEKLKTARLFMKNLSSERVYLRIGDAEAVVLMPEEGYLFKPKETADMIKVVAGKGRGGNVLLIRTGIRVPEGNLTTFAFYDADKDTNSGKSVGVCRVVTTRLKFPEPEKK